MFCAKKTMKMEMLVKRLVCRGMMVTREIVRVDDAFRCNAVRFSVYPVHAVDSVAIVCRGWGCGIDLDGRHVELRLAGKKLVFIVPAMQRVHLFFIEVETGFCGFAYHPYEWNMTQRSIIAFIERPTSTNVLFCQSLECYDQVSVHLRHGILETILLGYPVPPVHLIATYCGRQTT